MATQQEILQYKLDISDAEQKTTRLQALLETIKAKKAGGQDASALEEQFSREMDSLAKSRGAAQAGKTAFDDLIKSKEKLASVVGLVGGQFGGLVGRIGNVTEAALTGSTAVKTLAGALALLTAGVALYSDLAAAADRARQAMERAAAAASDNTRAGVAQRAEIAQQAATVGLFSAAGAIQAEENRLRERGVPSALARNTAIAGELARSAQRPFDGDNYLAGLVLSGGEPVAFEPGTRQGSAVNQRLIAATLRAGQRPEAGDALRRFIADAGPMATAEAPARAVGFDEQNVRLEVALAELRKRRPDLTDRELGAVQSIARMRLSGDASLSGDAGAVAAEAYARGVIPGSRLAGVIPSRYLPQSDEMRLLDEAGLGGAARTDDIGRLVVFLADLAAKLELSGDAGGGLSGGAKSQTVHYHNTTNIGTVIRSGGNPLLQTLGEFRGEKVPDGFVGTGTVR